MSELAERYRNRITRYDPAVPHHELTANPNNWRVHPRFQEQALEGVLDKVGWLGCALVNEHTGFVIDGHLRVAKAISEDTTVPVLYCDLSEEEEAIALATFDPIGALAVTDEAQFAQLTEGLQFDNEHLARVVAETLNDDIKGLEDIDPASGGADGAGGKVDRNALTFGYATFGETRVPATTGEVDDLARLHAVYKADHGGLDTGFVRWLIERGGEP